MKRTLKLPLLLIALTIAATAVAISYAQRLNQPLPPALNRLSEAKLVEIKDEASLVKAQAPGRQTQVLHRLALGRYDQ